MQENKAEKRRALDNSSQKILSDSRHMNYCYRRLFSGFIFFVSAKEDREVHEKYHEEKCSPNSSSNHRSLILVGSFCDNTNSRIGFALGYLFFCSSLLYILCWGLGIRNTDWIFTSLEFITTTSSNVFVISDNHPFNPVIADISISYHGSYKTNQRCECQIEAKHRESSHKKKEKK